MRAAILLLGLMSGALAADEPKTFDIVLICERGSCQKGEETVIADQTFRLGAVECTRRGYFLAQDQYVRNKNRYTFRCDPKP